MNTDLQELRSLRMGIREGGHLGEILDRLLDKVQKGASNRPEVMDAVINLKNRLDHLAQWLAGTVNRDAYTLEWDQIVRDTMKVFDQLEQEVNTSND